MPTNLSKLKQMKTLKFTLFAIAMLGIMASIYLVVETGSFKDQLMGFASGALLIFLGLNLEKITQQNNNC